MSKEQHDQARRELGFPSKTLRMGWHLRAEPNPWPDMEQSLMDDENF